jgi:hypothetical protein
MYRLFFAVVVCAMPLAGQGISPPPVDLNGYAEAALLIEWHDSTVYTDTFPNPVKRLPVSGTGAFYCLTAFDLFTRSGDSDPKQNAADAGLSLAVGVGAKDPKENAAYAVRELTVGNLKAEAVYKAVADALKSLLVPDKINISQNNKWIGGWSFSIAAATINAAVANDPDGFKTHVYTPYTKKDLPRALFGLLKTQEGPLLAYPVAKDANDTARKALTGAQAAELSRQQDLDRLKQAVSDARAQVAPAQTAVQAAIKKQKAAKAELAAAQDAAAQKKAKADQAKAEAELEKAEIDPKLLAYRAALEAADTAALDLKSAQDQVQALADQAALYAKAFEQATLEFSDACDVMEIYRICYALDSTKLFTFVADIYKTKSN